MKAYIAEPEQSRHNPPAFLVNGVFEANPERPDRVRALIAGATAASLTLARPPAGGEAMIGAVHSARYLAFLADAHTRWSRIEGAAPAVTPNIHPADRRCGYPASVVAQAGFHMIDASCPIVADTYESARWSAWSALAAAEDAFHGRDAYALCRPPGHHAGAETAGGFCYINNAAVAAETLARRGARVAILDLDLHHGNGTQEIFYRRGDVLTVSIHVDPVRFYPFFWGYAGETGDGDGAGFNVNLPLPRGAGDADFLSALDAARARISEFAPDAMIIALGLDGFEGDPIAGFRLSTDGFSCIGEVAARIAPRRCAIIQEGGYPCPELSENLTAFLSAFRAARGA